MEKPSKKNDFLRLAGVWIGLIALLIAVFVMSLVVGRYEIKALDSVRFLWEALRGITEDTMEYSIVLNIRLPRTLMALLVGSGLAVSGCAYQGMFQNPLVSPDVLGTSAGAAFGAVVGIMLSGMDYRAMLLSVVFGIVSVAIAFSISRIKGTSTVISLVLSGMIVQSLMNAMISMAKYVADPTEKLPAITYWLMGSFTSATYAKLKLVSIPILLGILVIFVLRWRINLLSLGDDECISLGINPQKTRICFILASTIITACCVMACGIIGWVGLVIPHISRMLVGVDHKRLIPVSFFAGAIFMIVVDVMARSLTAAELPISILTSLIGAPFFAILFRRRGMK